MQVQTKNWQNHNTDLFIAPVYQWCVVDVACATKEQTKPRIAQSHILQLGDAVYDLVDLHLPEINITKTRPYRDISPIIENRNINLEQQTNQNQNEKSDTKKENPGNA